MESDESFLINWNDGHHPGQSSTQNKMSIHKKKMNDFVIILDKALGDEWCSFIYDYSLTTGKSWGAYVTEAEALDLKNDPVLLKETDPEKAISLIVTRTLYFEKAYFLIKDDVAKIHGTAVWGLVSGIDSAVDYHIDYAELYRYETGIIVPPLFAGVLQVSDVPGMMGGDFVVNTGGLEHYKKNGYKACYLSPESFAEDMRTSKDWVAVPYKRNRAVLFDGNLPHTSTKVLAIESGKRRVVIGFNVFGYEVGECCQRAPEHSAAFNRTVKLYQTMASLGVPITSSSSLAVDAYTSSSPLPPAMSLPSSTATQSTMKSGVTAKDILSNPGLARLLVQAARKVKEARGRLGSTEMGQR